MTDKFKLTFNKPAVRQFLEGDDKGLRIRTENGVVMFKTAKTATADDATPLDKRTRGGFEAIVEGDLAADILTNLQNPHGPFFVLKRRNGWVAAEPYDGVEAPPKFEPHVRVWVAKETTATPAPKKTKARAPQKVAKNYKVASPDTPYLDTVRAAYTKLSEVARPGRPTNEERQARLEARELVSSFEVVAKELVGLPHDSQPLDLSGLIEAHKMIGDFINQLSSNGQPQTVVEETETPVDAPTKALAKTKAPSDDELAEQASRDAMAKMGLSDHDAPVTTRRRQRGPETVNA